MLNASCRVCIYCDDSRKQLIRDNGMCYNCDDKKHRIHGTCFLCGQTDKPIEYHHIAKRIHCSWYGINICLNCHYILSLRQTRFWNKDISHSMAIVQGAYDCIMLCCHSYNCNRTIFENPVTRYKHNRFIVGHIIELLRYSFIALFESFGLVLWSN